MRNYWVLIAAICAGLPAVASADFIAYNDFVTPYTLDTNVTHWGYDNSGAQILKDHDTGAAVTPTMTTTYYHISHNTSGPAAEISAGTDAANIFGGKVSTRTTVDAYNSGYLGNWYVEVLLQDLDPAKSYNLAAVLDRGSTSYINRRWTLISLLDTDSSTYASSSGAYQVSATSVSIDCYNTVNGYVAMWTGIKPGADGDLILRFAPAVDAELPEAYRLTNEDGRGYAPAGLMLQEVPEPASMALLALGALGLLKRRKK